MKTKTHPTLIRKVFQALNCGYTVQYEPTEENPLGRSGVHTFADDIITIVLNSDNEADAFHNIMKYLLIKE